MKTINIIFITLALGLFSSCKTGFYSQKYTNLKPLKAPTEKVDESAVSQVNVSSENEVQDADVENDEALISKEDQKLIQDAIAKGISIYVVAEKEIYQLINPSYDQFYNAISGGFHPITDESYLEKDHLELFQDDFSPSRIDPFIYMNNISAVLDYKVVAAPKVNAEPKENRNDSTKIKTETAVIPEKGDGSRVSLEEHRSAQYVKAQRRNSIIAAGAFALGITFYVLAILSGSFAAFAILALFAVGFYITFIVSITGAVIFNKRNYVITERRGYKVHTRSIASAVGFWILLFIISMPLLLIPFLIAIIAVACIRK